MARRHHYKRRTKQPAYEIDVTTFLNLMVVLVPFLLITAVFSRITILELSLPAGEGANDSKKPQFSIEVIVRQKGQATATFETCCLRISSDRSR